MIPDKLMKFISEPRKIAGVLERKKSSASILSIDFGRDRIGLAVAYHPGYGEPVKKLEPIDVKYEITQQRSAQSNNLIRKRDLTAGVVDELQHIVKEYNVSGLLVAWPVQKEGGHHGAPCGRVLHALDSIATRQDSNLLSQCILGPNRRFCLWDCGEPSCQTVDEFGRCSQFGVSTTKNLHIASIEQYTHESSSGIAANAWNEFCRTHWPDLYQHQDNIIDHHLEDQDRTLISL